MVEVIGMEMSGQPVTVSKGAATAALFYRVSIPEYLSRFLSGDMGVSERPGLGEYPVIPEEGITIAAIGGRILVNSTLDH